MTKHIRSRVLCILFASTAVFAAPQQSQTEPAPNAKPAPQQSQTFRQRLALSHEQQVQWHAINQDRKAQLDAVKADAALSPSARQEKIRAIHAAAETKIRALLNENQLAEYDQIKRERREQAARNRQTALPPQ